MCIFHRWYPKIWSFLCKNKNKSYNSHLYIIWCNSTLTIYGPNLLTWMPTTLGFLCDTQFMCVCGTRDLYKLCMKKIQFYN